jgi:hypothetical protein
MRTSLLLALALATACSDYNMNAHTPIRDVVVDGSDGIDEDSHTSGVPGANGIEQDVADLGEPDVSRTPHDRDPREPWTNPDDPWGDDPADPWAPLDPDHPLTTVPFDPGAPLKGGHFDVETTSFLSSIGNGSVDSHVHEYDVRYNVGGVDYFAVRSNDMDNLFDVVTDPNQRFKILIANPDLSPATRVVINRNYNPDVPRTYHLVDSYASIPLSDLPVFSLGGVAGSHKLEQLGLYFDEYAIEDRELIPTQTSCVVSNTLGFDGAWRNGAITLQVVAVDEHGDAFHTNPALSVGGAHGVAQSGLLFETTIFWHWKGSCSHIDGWETEEEPRGGPPHAH